MENKYDTLVLSGGSIHGIVILGCLQYLQDNNKLQHLKYYVGTSVGSIICYLIAIGYTPSEILAKICTEKLTEKLKDFNLMFITQQKGVTTFNSIEKFLKDMTLEKFNKLFTLEEFRIFTGKCLYFSTYNITKDETEILSHETYPDMTCIQAIHMSSNLPFIFDDLEYKSNFYIDGGVENNFPIHVGEEKGEKIIGIVLDKPTKFNRKNTVEYIYHLISIPYKYVVSEKIRTSKNSIIIKLKPFDILFINFDINTITKLEMFSSGYTQASRTFSC